MEFLIESLNVSKRLRKKLNWFKLEHRIFTTLTSYKLVNKRKQANPDRRVSHFNKKKNTQKPAFLKQEP